MNFFNNIYGFFAAATHAVPEYVGGGTAAAATAAADAANTASTTSGLGGIFDSYGIIIVWVAVIAFGYFFMYRGPKKEMKKKQEMRSSIKVGDSVITNSGIFGKVVEIGTDAFVLELGSNRGVRVPVLKDAVEGVREPNLSPRAEIVDKEDKK